MSYGIRSVAVNATADGENEVIAAVAGKRIMVVGGVLTSWHATAGAQIDLRSGTSNTVHARFQSGLVNAPAIITLQGDEASPCFECDIGDSLALNNAAGVDTTGFIKYMWR